MLPLYIIQNSNRGHDLSQTAYCHNVICICPVCAAETSLRRLSSTTVFRLRLHSVETCLFVCSYVWGQLRCVLQKHCHGIPYCFLWSLTLLKLCAGHFLLYQPPVSSPPKLKHLLHIQSSTRQSSVCVWTLFHTLDGIIIGHNTNIYKYRYLYVFTVEPSLNKKV